MSPNLLALLVGPFTSVAGIVGLLLVLLVVIVVGRVLLSVAWRLVLVALAVSVVLWGLGAVGLSPI
jgi:hypothetical protein